MAFDDKQNKALKAKLSYRHVKTRSQNGSTVHYIEGWRSIAEANRIFGYDAWDRQTMAPECLWSERRGGQLVCLYSSKVRITVRTGQLAIVREGIGTGFGRADNAEAAHEIALKAAETDATKRALATFGNPFGLALYDKEQSQVTKPAKRLSPPSEPLKQPTAAPSEFVLKDGQGHAEHYASPETFIEATQKAVSQLKTTSAVYTFWEANLPSLNEFRRHFETRDDDPVRKIIATLKAKIRAVGRAANGKEAGQRSETVTTERPSQLAFPKETRSRDQAHLAFVARHPCLVCGRQPAQAHHVRFAQPRAMSMKVSDEYAVPLCNGHHDALHRTGDERAWWASRCIDPLAFAERLWTETDKTITISLAHVPAEEANKDGGNNAKPDSRDLKSAPDEK